MEFVQESSAVIDGEILEYEIDIELEFDSGGVGSVFVSDFVFWERDAVLVSSAEFVGVAGTVMEAEISSDKDCV